MVQDSQKKVDESWKESVQKERTASPGEPARPQAPAEAPAESEFLGFISTLAMQTLLALGEVPHPETGEPHGDLPQARYLIDILQLLSEKTKGNLTTQEENELKNLVYELKMKYVRKEQALPQ